MSVRIEKLEHSMVKFTIEISADEFIAAMKDVYQANKSRYYVRGFKKGNVAMAYLEKVYGSQMFYEDAANNLIDREYPKAVWESGLEITSYPEIEVVQIEKGKDFIFTVTVAVKPEVTLGKYKGIAVSVSREEVTETEMQEELLKEQAMYAKEIDIDGRAVMDNDIVDIDYSGSIDGVLFEGGTAQGQRLVIGSNSFIEGFEEQIIGHNIGDEFDIHVVFPEQYHAPEVAGKPAVFAIRINGIREKVLPELNDVFAKEVCGFDTLDEWKAGIRKTLENRKEAEMQTKKENAVVEKVIENAQMDIADAMIKTAAKKQYKDLETKLQYQGISMEQYLQYTGMTEEAVIEGMIPNAKKSIQTKLVLEAIAEVEKIDATEAELAAEYSKIAQEYKLDIEAVKEYMQPQLDTLKKEIAMQKVLTFITEAAIEI